MAKLSAAVAILVVTLFPSIWAVHDALNYKHSLHLSVNKADDPRLSLTNLEHVANSILDFARGRRNSPPLTSPYATNPRCSHQAEYRTIDGTCNNLGKPWIGAAKTPLARLSRHRYQDGITDTRSMYYKTSGSLPSARQVSVNIYMTRDNHSSHHSHLLMGWGQFTDHDFTISPESGGEGGEEPEKSHCCQVPTNNHVNNLKECFPIRTHNDPVFRRTCIPFLRSAPVPGFPNSPAIRYQMNDLTAYIDGSQVYGNTYSKARALRSHRGGLLRSKRRGNEELLPDKTDNPSNCQARSQCQFAAGDVRNSEQAGLTSLHTLMLREHNRIARQLQSLNKHWSDEKLYQTARKIVGAILQRVTYKEFLPEVLGHSIMNKYGLTLQDYGRYGGYSSHEDPSIFTEFSTAAFRFGHSLVRQTFSRGHGAHVDLEDMFDSFKTVNNFGADGLMKGMLTDRVERCDRFISRGLRDNLFGEEADLMSFNIQRGRDHGLASYSDVRNTLNLHVHDDYNNMAGSSHSHSMTNDFKKVYPSPHDMELFVAGLTETPLPGAVVGETFANLIGLQFQKLRRGDRFWHETPDIHIGFTDSQLQEIRKSTLAMLYCENVPNTSVRRKLFVLESHSNPTVSCSSIAKIDLSKWLELGGQTHTTFKQPSGTTRRQTVHTTRRPRGGSTRRFSFTPIQSTRSTRGPRGRANRFGGSRRTSREQDRQQRRQQIGSRLDAFLLPRGQGRGSFRGR